MVAVLFACLAFLCVLGLYGMFYALVLNIYAKYAVGGQPKLIDISSGRGMFVARDEQEAMGVIQSKSHEASDGDISYVRYSDGGSVRLIVGIYSVADGKVSITYLRQETTAAKYL